MIRKYIRKPKGALSKLKLMILFYIASFDKWEIITQTSIANALNKPITTLNYHILQLREQSLLDKENHLTPKGKKVLRYLKHWDKTFDKILRAHKIQVTLFLSKVPKDLDKNTIFTPFSNERYSGLRAELLGCTFMVYSPKKAVVVFPDIYGNNDEEIASALCDVIQQLIVILEDEFKIKVECYKPAKFSSMHVSILDSVIADLFLLENKRCYSNGRVAIDFSHGRAELEAENCYTALEDIEVLVKYEDLARENQRLKEEVAEVESSLKRLRKEQGKESTLNHEKPAKNKEK